MVTQKRVTMPPGNSVLTVHWVLPKGNAMADLLAIGNWLLPLLYLALLADYGATFFLRTRTEARSPWLVVVVAVHLVFLALRGAHLGYPPVTSGQEIASVLALATAGVYAWVELAGRDRRTGVFVLLLAFLFQYTSSMLLAGRVAEPSEIAPGAVGVWARLHVVPALVAYTALAFAGVYGLLYLLEHRGLRRHRFGVLFDRLPPLDVLEPMAWHALLTGFVAMTVAIAAGPLLLRAEGGEMTAKVLSKIVTGSVAWVVCAVAILGRWLGKWPAARTSATAVVGFIIVMALMIVSGLLS